MVDLFLINPFITKENTHYFKEYMKKIFKNGFNSFYNKKIVPNKYLISNYGKLLFGEHTIWPGLIKVTKRSSGYFVVGYEDNLIVLKDLEIESKEIESLIATIIGHMELSNQLEIIKDYREQD